MSLHVIQLLKCVFFSYLIEKYENVLPSVRILLQHMCMKCPDKAEYRGKVAQVITL